MHAYRKFVQEEMDKRGWTAAELSRASGLSRQNLSRILNDDRDVLQRRPEPPTISALAQAFRYREDYVLSYVAEAMGFSSDRVRIADASALSNEELLRVLAERLSGGGDHEHDDKQAAGQRAAAAGGSAVAYPTQPDGISTDAGRRPRQEDYDRAAMAGTSDLDRLDRDAAAHGEESQDPEDWT